MTLKCYDKPNRKEVRHFTSKDVERIAKYAVRDGADPVRLIAGIAAAAGLGYLMCKASKVLDAFATIGGLVKTVSVTLATAVLIDRAIQWLSKGYLQKLPFARQLLVALTAISVYIAATDILQGDDVGVVVEAVGSVDDVADFLRKICEYIKVIEKG